MPNALARSVGSVKVVVEGGRQERESGRSEHCAEAALQRSGSHEQVEALRGPAER